MFNLAEIPVFMERLNLPVYSFKIKSEKGRKFIFDESRRKYVQITPEEWVRQNFIRYLVAEKKVPLSLVSAEHPLKVHEVHKRCDIIVFGREGNPLMIVECKAPSVKVTRGTFEQIARYNTHLKVPHLVVTNGLNHYCCRIDHEKGTYTFLESIPPYPFIQKA